MQTSDDKVGGWVKKGQNHDDVILEWSLIPHPRAVYSESIKPPSLVHLGLKREW